MSDSEPFSYLVYLAKVLINGNVVELHSNKHSILLVHEQIQRDGPLPENHKAHRLQETFLKQMFETNVKITLLGN